MWRNLLLTAIESIGWKEGKLPVASNIKPSTLQFRANEDARNELKAPDVAKIAASPAKPSGWLPPSINKREWRRVLINSLGYGPSADKVWQTVMRNLLCNVIQWMLPWVDVQWQQHRSVADMAEW